MPRIKPVSSLRNYNQVLRDISVGEPVFLTKNGRGSQATIKLLGELNKGRKSGEEKGWVVHEDVKRTTLQNDGDSG
jgi:antitoxin (DNA-binding transcriptional repressor) of toxin-antitoxin stability system